MQPLRVFVGYDSREPAAYHTFAHSLLRHASRPIAIIPLVQDQLRTAGLYTRERGVTEATEFSMTRFLVPYLCGYSGMAIFADCDMLAQADIYELLDAKGEHAVWCCQHDYVPTSATKMEGQVQTAYPRKNWSSLMLFNNGSCHALTPSYVNRASGLDLHRFNWLHESDPVGALPLEWNWLVGEYAPNPAAKILHFTEGGPWFRDYQRVDHADLWRTEHSLITPRTTWAKESWFANG